MSKRPITPLAMAVPAAKGAAYVPEIPELPISNPLPCPNVFCNNDAVTAGA